MINKDELLYKIDTIINYLKENKGYKYKVYDKLCPDDNNEPDSNIVLYAEDIKELIKELPIKNNITITDEDLPF